MKTPRLSEDELREHLANLPDWTRQGEEIARQYTFKDFTHAMQFVNHVAQEADAVNHHPDIDIRYNKVTLTLSTHDSGGLTQADISLAAAADDAADAVTA